LSIGRDYGSPERHQFWLYLEKTSITEALKDPSFWLSTLVILEITGMDIARFFQLPIILLLYVTRMPYLSPKQAVAITCGPLPEEADDPVVAIC
jgi:hypothetical protein